MSHILCKSDVTYTSSSGEKNVRESETSFLVSIKGRVPNLNKSKWKILSTVQDLLCVTDNFASIFRVHPSFPPSLHPSLLPFFLSSFLPSFLPFLFLPFLPFLSSNILQVYTKCQIPVYTDSRTQFLPSWSLQSNVGSELEIDVMTIHNDKSLCEAGEMEGSGRMGQERVGPYSRRWEYIYA